MKSRPAIIAALPREVKPLVKGWEAHMLPGHIALYTHGEAVVACAGMGRMRAELAVRAAMAVMPVTAVISVGLAGACNPKLKAGEIVRAGVVIDDRTGDRFTASQFDQVLVSADAIADAAEKARLHAAFRADAVDMEAATVARLARHYGLEFHAIKAISDEAGFEMDSLSHFVSEDGRFREAAFALHVAVRPWQWGRAMELGGNSRKAVRALTAVLRAELDWYSKRT